MSGKLSLSQTNAIAAPDARERKRTAERNKLKKASSSIPVVEGNSAARAAFKMAHDFVPEPESGGEKPKDASGIVVDCVDDLASSLQSLIRRADLDVGEVEEHWPVALACLEFLTHKHFHNPWRDKRKMAAGALAAGGEARNEYWQRFSALSREEADPEDFYEFKDDPLGVGGFATVFDAKRLYDGKRVAIKKLDHHDLFEFSRNYVEAGLMTVASATAQANICEYYDSFSTKDGEFWIIMEAVDGITLADLVDTFGAQPTDVVARIANDTLSGLAHLHRLQVVHRDIKSSNIMLSVTNAKAVIIDFGLARDISESGGCSMCGSAAYIPPEMPNYEVHSLPADIYSFGVCVFQMLSGFTPNRHAEALHPLFIAATKGINADKLRSEMVEDVACEFVDQCVRFNQKDRPRAKKLLKHEFLQMQCDKAKLREVAHSATIQFEKRRS